MVRYTIDPFTYLIQDAGSGPHALAELGVLLSRLLDEGITRESLIKLIMESFGITASEATKLVDQALGWDKDEPEPEIEENPEPEPNEDPSPF